MWCSVCTTCLWCVEPCRYEDIRHTSFQLHPCGGLPTERCFRLAVLSFLLSFSCLVQVGKPCGTTMLQHKATADQALPPLSKHIPRLACQGFCTRVIGGYRFFLLPYRFTVNWTCFQKNGHANTTLLHEGFYTLSGETIKPCHGSQSKQAFVN